MLTSHDDRCFSGLLYFKLGQHFIHQTPTSGHLSGRPDLPPTLPPSASCPRIFLWMILMMEGGRSTGSITVLHIVVRQVTRPGWTDEQWTLASAAARKHEANCVLHMPVWYSQPRVSAPHVYPQLGSGRLRPLCLCAWGWTQHAQAPSLVQLILVKQV